MTDQTPSCFHCGLPVPEGLHLPIVYRQSEHPACCAGCQAVAQSIIDAGLDSYYRHRTANPEQAALPPPEILEQIKLYDLPEVQTDFVAVLPENRKEATLMLSGISCAACVWLIEQQLLRLNGVENTELNYSSHRARITWDDSRLHLSDILLKIRQSGYQAAPYDPRKMEAQAQRERKQLLVRLAVAGLCSMQTMMFALPTYLFDDIEPQYLTLLHWGAFLMVLPVVFYAATPFYKGALRDLKNRRTGMDTPVALAIILAFTACVYGLLMGGSEQSLYFEGIAMFVFFLQTGRFAEHAVRRKAGDAAERLVKLVPAFCHRLPDYPHSSDSSEAAVAALQSGDVIAVRAGEVIPVDGTVLEGESEVNEAMLTGEHLPVAKVSGSRVTAGTLNGSSLLIVRATETGNDTRLAHIVRLLDRALSQKPRLAVLADRYAAKFTLRLIVFAVLTFCGWWWYADAHTALWVTVSLLVITCPCALSLATPAALAAATGKLAGDGVLIARSHALETLAAATDIVFDKTGTLTQGRPAVAETLLLGDHPHALAAAHYLESHSEHPAARAILALPADKLPENAAAAPPNNRVGQGLSTRLHLNGRDSEWRIGRPEFVAEISGALPEQLNALMQRGSVAALGNEDGFQAAFLLRDEVKPDAAAAVAALRGQGLNVHILSGDREAAVRQLADTLGIGSSRAQALPEDKLAYVQALQSENKRVLMVGDGINDAPVLAAADVSAAVAGSADVARDGADVVLLNDDLGILPAALNHARRTRAIIRQNLIWASLYNIIAVPLAAAGLVTPWIAALGMSASSLLVVGNALRLRK